MWFYPDTPISSKNKIDHHDITKIFVESSVKHHNPNPKILNFLQVMPYFSHEEQELLTVSGQLGSVSVFKRVCVAQSLVFCTVFLWIISSLYVLVLSLHCQSL
jgi:hypothetical protein